MSSLINFIFISIDQLYYHFVDEYHEINGTGVPFKQIGFNSLQEFLRNHPDKFRVSQMGADFGISAVLEKGGMADLARLVQGQKSSKKKKSKATHKLPVYKKPSVYSNFDVMILSLNEAMKTKKKLIDSKNPKENSICVGQDPASKQYCRLQIIMIDKEREDKVII